MGEISAGKSKPTRVLHIVGSMVRGGSENWIMSLLRKADRSILEMDVCVMHSGKAAHNDEIIASGAKLMFCEPKPVFTFQRRLARIIQNGRYDVVHSHMWLFSGLVLKVAAQCNVPVRIAYCHTAGTKPSSLYRVLYYRYMKYLVKKHSTHRLGCASEAVEALFGKNWQSLKNCRVLYCSINVDAYEPGQISTLSKSDFGFADDAIVIGHIGEFRLAKNHTFFLDIAAELVKLEPRAHFFFAGDGKLREQMEEKAHKLSLSNHVVFAGVRDDVPQLLMHLFDVLLFPSFYEGMPLTLVEAAAAGLRTVCSDAITNEATDSLPEAFTRLALDSGTEEWAKVVNETIKKGRIPHANAYQRIKESHFSDDFSLRELSKIYGCNAP